MRRTTENGVQKIADVSALGYGAFSLTLWLVSMGSAGWFQQPGNVLLTLLAMVLGGCVLTVAGILQCLRARVLDSVLFLAFAAYWWVAALNAHMLGNGASAPSAGFLGWYYMVWTVFVACIWLAACRDGVARMLFTLGLCLSLFAFALANWTHNDALTVLGGYLGLVTAVVGLYTAAAEIINTMHGHTVLPLGERNPATPEVVSLEPADPRRNPG